MASTNEPDRGRIHAVPMAVDGTMYLGKLDFTALKRQRPFDP